ncbi:Peptidase S46 [Chitinophaga costaii]|uniref:Peptidase S46 n=1 Tax=Chitinophaga costaii TaxID=1335309 RepID=A0A1C4AAA3_9BACT|nr:Peptidase S46 [Chitinophaga costaii]
MNLKTTTENPAIVNLRDVRLKAMLAQMKKDPAVRLKLASYYAGVANYWKFYDGESKQLLKYNVESQKKKQEAAFNQWAQDKPAYAHIFSDYAKAYDEWKPYVKQRVYIGEGILGSPLAAFAANLMLLERALTTTGAPADALPKALVTVGEARKTLLESEDRPSDQEIIAATAHLFYTDIPKDQQPIGFFENIRSKFGDLNDNNTWRIWAAALMNNTFILNDKKWNDFVAHPDAVTLQQDPAFAYADAFLKNYYSKYQPIFALFTSRNQDLGRAYLKGVMEMEPNKQRYPDATSTMRVTYGNVKAYSPRDAVHYDYACTMAGVMEKYVPGDYEFDLPSDLIDLYKKKDFGPYKDAEHNDMVVCFITTNDITGGNSGSPVLNGNGELIGLAFDGNYEALSHKIQFDPVYNRTICVDVRYVLWCIDKLGGAKNLINELKLSGGAVVKK